MTIAHSKPCCAPYTTLVAAILMVGFLVRPVSAAQLDGINVVVGGTVRHESNLFRQPTAAVSDTVSTGSVGLGVDKSYSLQRFQFNASETTTRYDKTARLNFDGLAYRGAWLWQLGSRLSGTLTADHTESSVPFEDTLGNTQRNVRTSDRRAFNLNWWVTGGWYLITGIAQSDQKSDQTVQIQPDFRAVNTEAGIKYEAPSVYSVSGIRRSTRGDYRNQPVSAASGDYHQDESELNLSWTLSGKSSITGRLAWLERTSRDPSRPKFSGPSSSLSYVWTPTGRLSLNISGTQQTSALFDPSFGYIETDSLSFTPAWKYSDRTTVSLQFTRINLKYRGTGSVPAVGPARSDTTDNATVAVNWLATRSLSVGASLQRQHRTTNTPGTEFAATIGSVNGSLKF